MKGGPKCCQGLLLVFGFHILPQNLNPSAHDPASPSPAQAFVAAVPVGKAEE